MNFISILYVKYMNMVKNTVSFNDFIEDITIKQYDEMKISFVKYLPISDYVSILRNKKRKRRLKNNLKR
jgi:hypothetical protein